MYVGTAWLVKVKHNPSFTVVCVGRELMAEKVRQYRVVFGESKVTTERFNLESSMPVPAINS